MDLSKHLEKAEEAVKRRGYPLAIDIYNKLLAMQPDNGEARRGLRTALFKRAEAKPPSKLFALLGGGVHLLTGSISSMIGKHAAAAKAFERYLAHDPLNEGVNLKLGRMLEQAGLRHSALAVFQAWAEHQPRCLEASRSAGALLYEQGEMSQAMAMYEQALRIDPRDQESLKARKNLAAEGALEKSGLEKAQSSRDLMKDTEAQRRIERDQRLQLSAEEVSAELDELEPQLAERPDDTRLLRRVADLRMMQDDVQGALDCLEQLLRAQPDDGELADRAGDLRIRLQEKRVAEADRRGDSSAADGARGVLAELRVGEYRRRVERNPADLGLRFRLGTALVDQGELDEGIAQLQQAVKDPRSKVEALLCLGRAFQAKGLEDLALGQMEKALEAAGAGGKLAKEILYEMGVLNQTSGRTEQALAVFSRILEQDISYRDVARRVEQLKTA